MTAQDDDFESYRQRAKCAARMEEIPFSSSLSRENWHKARKGFRPRDMDDKWRVGFHDPFLEFYRSWTNTLVYKLKVDESDESVELGPLFAARDVDWYNPHPEWGEVTLVRNVMEWCLGLKGFSTT